MKARTHVVYGGARPLYEVIESEDEVSVTIRYAGDHNDQIRLHRSGVVALVDVLKEVKPISANGWHTLPERAAAATAKPTGS
jgi:hypothetical protein